MNNDFDRDQKIEKKLKDKMNEMSASLDCFDKISSRAFPKIEQYHSNDEFVISDLENITGKRKHISVIKAFSAIAAAVVCITLIPKTGLIDRLMCEISTPQSSYSSILAEFKAETENNTYYSYDVSLEYYSKYDLLVTPFNCCPFENNDLSSVKGGSLANSTDDVRVRIFVKTIDWIQTEQMYAVEYGGNDFSEENFIAIADSAVKVHDTPADGNDFYDNTNDIYTILDNYCSENNHNNLSDPQGNAITLAETTFSNYFSSDNKLIPVKTTLFYGHGVDRSQDDYFYDIISYAPDGSIFDTGKRQNSWNSSVYRDGNSAMPSENESLFNSEKIVGAEANPDRSSMWSLSPVHNYISSNTFPTYDSITTELYKKGVGPQGIVSTLNVPKFSLSSYNDPEEELCIILAPDRIEDNIIKISSEDGLELSVDAPYICTQYYLKDYYFSWLDDLENEAKTRGQPWYEEINANVSYYIDVLNIINNRQLTDEERETLNALLEKANGILQMISEDKDIKSDR